MPTVLGTLFLHLQDILLTPVYFLIIAFWLKSYSKKKFKNNKYDQKYFYLGAIARMFGGIFLGIIYEFVYHGGDTSAYWLYGTWLTDIFIKHPSIGIQLFWDFGDKYSYEVISYIKDNIWYPNPAEFFICLLSGFIGIFAFKTYSVIAIFFALISFTGSWKMYQTFTQIYPQLRKQFMVANLFVPSVVFWGGGLMKDGICLGALGWLLWAFYNGLIEKKKIIKCLIVGIICIYTLYTIKVYILLAFLPPALNWVFLEQIKKIKNKLIKILATPILISVGLAMAAFGATNLTEGNERFDIENIGERTKINKDALSRSSASGSAYNIGELDGSLGSVINVAPQAVVVTLFRPFLWEVNNIVMILSALEATLFIIFTFYFIYKGGFFKSIQLIGTTPILLFCFVFAIIFSIGVGTSSGNFGTLVRYKIPMIPFYVSALCILWGYNKKSINMNPKRQRN